MNPSRIGHVFFSCIAGVLPANDDRSRPEPSSSSDHMLTYGIRKKNHGQEIAATTLVAMVKRYLLTPFIAKNRAFSVASVNTYYCILRADHVTLIRSCKKVGTGKSACWSLSDNPTKRQRKWLLCKYGNWNYNGLFIECIPFSGRYSGKNIYIFNYFSSFTGHYIVSDYQFTASSSEKISSVGVSMKNTRATPETGRRSKTLPPYTEKKLIQEGYEQFFGFRSYNGYYKEPEMIMDCQCRQMNALIGFRPKKNSPFASTATWINPVIHRKQGSVI